MEKNICTFWPTQQRTINTKVIIRFPTELGDAVLAKKVHYIFSCKIKDTFFSFINNFIDLDLLIMKALSRYRFPVGRGQGAAKHLSMHKTAPQ